MTGAENGGRDRSYQALRESEALHRATLESISDAVFLADDQGMFRFVCPNVDVIFGYDPEEVHAIGRLEGLLGPDLFDPAELVRKGEIRNLEREVTAKGGERRALLIHLKRVAINGGTVLCTCRDVTDLKLAEHELAATRQELGHASRLALVGQLLTSMAHEIQQPLASINLSTLAALRTLEGMQPQAKADRLRETIANIRSASTGAFDTIRELRALARKKPLELHALDVNGVASDVLRLVRPDAVRRGVTLRTDFTHELPMVGADRTGLQQVILDLVVNAMDAMEQVEGERRVTVRTRRRVDAVEVAVRDWGRGVDAACRARLFEPFFTTKSEGLGLGLAISHSIVTAHGGQISLDARPSRGATFRVRLPALADAAGATQAAGLA